MPKMLAPDRSYSARRPDAVVVNTTLDAEAVEILKRYCPPGRKATGKFLARLLYEHDARQQERRSIQEQVEEAVRRDVDPGDARQGAERGGQFLGDRARRLLEGPRKLEGERHRQVAERSIRRHLYSESWQFRKVVLQACRVGDGVVDLALNVENHQEDRSVGKFVIRLQFVTSGRVEALVLGRRVDVGQQPMMVAQPVKLVAGYHADPHISEKIQHLQLPPAAG